MNSSVTVQIGVPPGSSVRIAQCASFPSPIETSTALPLPDASQMSPTAERIRHHLIPARTSTCVRAPCLKRQASTPVSGSRSPIHAGVAPQDRVISNPLPTSFAAPRNFLSTFSGPPIGPRHVHFDDAPPEEFFVLSSEKYDRTSIKCTEGGSEFDMSLPPRSASYADDESADDDASSSDERSAARSSSSSQEVPAPDVGPFQDPSLENWACIKNGTVMASVGYQPRRQQHSGLMASGKSLHFSALSSLQQASALAAAGDAQKRGGQAASAERVSLPVHGFRSFGGLQNSLSTDIHVQTPSSEEVPSVETTPPAVKLCSPDATPMPSPSLQKSIGRLSSIGYFAAPQGDEAAQSFLGGFEKTLNNQNDERRSNFNRNDDVVADRPDSSEDSSDTHASEQSGHMEVLKDAEEILGSPLSSQSTHKRDLPLMMSTSIPDSHLIPESGDSQAPPARRVAMERRMADMQLSKSSLLSPIMPCQISANGAVGWTNLLGVTSSPLSSRCSSVDPWSGISSDGDGDGTESPSHEASWISSNCTSPDLAPAEHTHDGFGPKLSPSTSGPSWLETRAKEASAAVASTSLSHVCTPVLTHQTDLELNHSTPKETQFREEARFSSSVETVHTTHWNAKSETTTSPPTRFSGLPSADLSMSEATTPDSSRRPSFRSFDSHDGQMSPRNPLRSQGDPDTTLDDLDEDDLSFSRVRSPSRDGHSKKSKSSKCKACRLLRHRLKNGIVHGAGVDSSNATSSTGSAQITDAENESSGQGSSPMQRCSSSDREMLAVSGHQYEHDETESTLSISRLRSSVRSMSVSDQTTWSFRSRSADRSLSFDSSVRSKSPRVKQTGAELIHERDSSHSPSESSAESPAVSSIGLPIVCTCDRKKDRERLKKKVRRERELERERDREWEQDQARGRQKKLFGESFGDVDGSCLDGF
ncbi:hypothetical protein BCV70DRAFT_107317 [Testicularia cyperi]|uniref:Uncharacterized protein n=1 Tax=Testicularia cyperi TaxID=1882483 RepID=A0A317XSG1_9BASI|nr:hypothetical protein BCV70DRAFT_107317 [Testicularia cyperi]